MTDAPRRLGGRDARRLSIALSIGCLALVPFVCRSPETTVPDEAAPELRPVQLGDVTEPVAAAPLVKGSCEALAASDDDRDLALLPELCPGEPLTPRAARAALLAAGTPSKVRAIASSLARSPEHAELVALAGLVVAPAVPMPEALPDPADASVSPVDDEVLSWARGAEVALVAKGVEHDDRTRARALLAKIHLQALLRLGVVPGEPMPPFTRRVAALALHHGRTFVTSYWRRRVAGLEEIFAETELQLSRVLSALEVTPFHRDDVLLADERDGVRAWLSGESARRRVAAARSDGWDGPGETIEAELERLVAQGMFDLAVDRAAAIAGDGDDPIGLATLEHFLVEASTRWDRPEGPARIRVRMDRVRARPTPPLEDGPGRLHAPAWPWPGAELVAADALAWAVRAREADGFGRTHAIARAVAILRDRPDAAREVVALAREHDSAQAVRDAASWALRELQARDPGRPSDLRALAEATDDPDRARRLSFAADALP